VIHDHRHTIGVGNNGSAMPTRGELQIDQHVMSTSQTTNSPTSLVSPGGPGQDLSMIVIPIATLLYW